MKEKIWIEKIKEGMELIKQGCSENTKWSACYDCPFKDFCELIMLADEECPSESFLR